MLETSEWECNLPERERVCLVNRMFHGETLAKQETEQEPEGCKGPFFVVNCIFYRCVFTEEDLDGSVFLNCQFEECEGCRSGTPDYFNACAFVRCDGMFTIKLSP